MHKTINSFKERLFGTYDGHLDHSGIKGARIGSRLLDIANIGFTDDMGSCRLGYSEEEKLAKQLIKKWMKEAGLEIKEDSAGNVIGRMDGKENDLPAIMSGSHIDTVPNGGHFDGVLGILAALEVCEAWMETNYIPYRPFEIVVFADEEGSRFNAGLTGSQAMMGEIDFSTLALLKDHQGISFEDMLNNIGLSPSDFLTAARNPKELAAFVEVHIEQGEQLEKHQTAIGIVTGIAGQNGLEITIKGKAGHAGNTPMEGRQDALVAASELILSIKKIPQKVSSSAVATVGRLQVYPNGSNVIPGEVKLTVDIRDIHQHSLDHLTQLIKEEAFKISDIHKVEVNLEETLKVESVPLTAEMQNLQTESLKELNIAPIYIPSGAGHDAMIIGRHIPVAMFFVRSIGGISHNPKEWTSLNDCVTSVHALKIFLEKLQHSV